MHDKWDSIVKECNVLFWKQGNEIVMLCEKCNCSPAGCTMFLVFPPGSRMYRFVGCPTLEYATYSCPCKKLGFCMWIPAIFRDCPCALSMDIGKAKRTGNYIISKPKDKSVRICGLRGMNTSLPLVQPVRIVASIVEEYRFFTKSLVLLHNSGDTSFDVT